MYRALIVCNSHFPDDPGELPPLHGPKVDGILLRDALAHHQTGLFHKGDVEFYLDADYFEIIRAIDDFFGQGTPDDILLFYYSGHGRSRNQQLFLCTKNTVAEKLHSTAVSQSTLNGILSNSFSKAKILILDCCHSGLFKGQHIVDGIGGEGRYIIAASSATDLVTDSKRKGIPSPFTMELIQALLSEAEDRNGDGVIDLDDIFAYLSSKKVDGFHPRRSFDGTGSIPIARRNSARITASSDDPPIAVNPGRPVNMLQQDQSMYGAIELQYLDRTAPGVSYSQVKTSLFRRLLRPDIANAIPDQLNASEFLQRAGLLQNGTLTYTGVLLFGNDYPSVVLPSAVVQCARFYGASKSDHLDSTDIYDTVPEAIVRARDFVADACRMGEIPIPESSYAEPAYRYPMVAVREVIANAIVHRDYEVRNACIQIHMYDDRLEVISPGAWGDSSAGLTPGQVGLGELQQQSRRRNFRLAQILTWSRLVEGVGAGIPRAIQDCMKMNSLEPLVTIDENSVTVTLYPSDAAPVSFRRSKHSKQDSSKPDLLRLPAVNSSNPLFFLSHASSPKIQGNNLVVKFFEDLSDNVAELVDLPPDTAPGYMSIADSGDYDHWTDALLEALGTCQVFIPLLSLRYFASVYCAKEWYVFSLRDLVHHPGVGANDGVSRSGVLPVLWTGPIPETRIPHAIRGAEIFQPTHQPDRDLNSMYNRDGIVGLMQVGPETTYQAIVWRMAQRIAMLYDGQHVKERSFSRAAILDSAQDIFRAVD